MDLYELLGVRRNASLAEIRRAYQRKARALHPALNPGDPGASERFQIVVRAFEILSDPRRRASYDKGEEAVAVVAAHTHSEVLFEGFDFESSQGRGAAFHEIFQDPAAPPGTAPPSRGEDLEQVARISFEESMRGTHRRLHVVRHDRCPACGGRGDVAQQGEKPCASCGGLGQIRARRGHMLFSRTCGECGGRGVTTAHPCPRCQGEGRLIQSEWLDVEIPGGVGNGSRVRLPGLGNAGRRDGAPGDLTLVIDVEPHPLFRREGDDLHCTVPVTVVEAAAGAHIAAPTPDGSVTIEIPAGTQNGQRFRLRKRGAPRLGSKGRGDLYVEARVVVPTVTDERGRALLKELDTLYPHDPRKEMTHGTQS
jgi:molecular chaperone DnaJ